MIYKYHVFGQADMHVYTAQNRLCDEQSTIVLFLSFNFCNSGLEKHSPWVCIGLALFFSQCSLRRALGNTYKVSIVKVTLV